jgi:DNA-binding transcriptional regulator PaaX
VADWERVELVVLKSLAARGGVFCNDVSASRTHAERHLRLAALVRLICDNCVVRVSAKPRRYALTEKGRARLAEARATTDIAPAVGAGDDGTTHEGGA